MKIKELKVECWECEEEYNKNEVFDIPVKAGWTVKWCFNCAIKQGRYHFAAEISGTDLNRLIPKPKCKKLKKKVII